MIEFINSFFIDGFVPGEYVYGTIHIFSIVFVLILIPFLIYIFKGKSSDEIYNRIRIIAIITLVVYFVRRGIDVYNGKSILEAYWPFYICNINTIFLSIFIIFKVKKGQDFFMITGILGAVLMFVVPDGVFNDKYLTIQILDSVLSHYEIVVLPIVLMATKAYKLDIRKSWQVFLGLFILLFNVEILQPILTDRNVDYLFIRGTLPFTIEGVPQLFIMLFTIGIYVYIIYGIHYLLNNKELIKSKSYLKR